MRAIAYISTSLCSIAIAAQTIVITFEGTLNGTPTPLDSILVMNLTQGGDTTIYFPDNTLVLGTTGLNERPGNAPMFSAMPNPFEASTEVHVVSASQGDMLVLVHDASGREVASVRMAGAPGVHRFQFTAPAHGIYVMSVTQNDQRGTLRLVSTEGSGNWAELHHLGAISKDFMAKSDRSVFLWEAGDELRYIGYANQDGLVHSGAIQEVPTATVTHTFNLVIGAVCPDSPTVTDIDGNTYPVVQIGTQCWMAANLKTNSYSDGSIILNVTDYTAWGQLNSGAWSNYNNSPGNDAIYGKLYNWYAAADPIICPQGWHVPTDAEWQQLESALGMPSSELGLTWYRGVAQNVGGRMKTTSLWVSPNTTSTNESGFSGPPGGSRGASNGSFGALGFFGYWWSASDFNTYNAWYRRLSDANAGIDRGTNGKGQGFSVRCVRD